MKEMAFAQRNGKEILRDPLSLVFGVGFPVVLILMIALMKRSIATMPVELFKMSDFAPGMAVFGLSFLSLFLGTLISNDRSSSFLMRLFASPLTASGYIVGYSLPLVPIALAQGLVCFLTAGCVGLPLGMNTLMAVAVLVPVALLFIGLGLLFGSLLSGSQVGGIASILVNVAAWLSGTWFDLDLMGGAFRGVCYALPFAHAVDAVKLALAGSLGNIWLHLAWVMGYALMIYLAAIWAFRRRMKG